VPFFGQPLAQQVGHVGFVFHDQKLHRQRHLDSKSSCLSIRRTDPLGLGG
jgi:hypothetical protein